MDKQLLTSLFEGDSYAGIALCQGLTGGDFWARVQGCQILYQCIDVYDPQRARIACAANAGKTAVCTPGWIKHKPSMSYWYFIRRADTRGDLEFTGDAVAKAEFDANGNLVDNSDLRSGRFECTGVLMPDKRFVLQWFYRCGDTKVCKFAIYVDNGSDDFHFVASVSYHSRQWHRLLSEPLVAGRYRFAIKAVDGDGMERDASEIINVSIIAATPLVPIVLRSEAI